MTASHETTTILFGCANLRGPWETYAKRHDLLEVALPDASGEAAKGEPTLKPATLRRMRKQAGPTLRFSVVVPPALALLRPGPAYDAALAQTIEAQRLLEARHVLVRTPVDVTPAALPRERLTKLFERLREGFREAAPLVSFYWEPRGVWQPEDAMSFARKLDVGIAGDPLLDPREPVWHPRLRYVRVGTVGGRTAYPPTRLRMLAELLTDDTKAEYGPRLVVFTTPQAPKELKRLRALVQQTSARPRKRGTTYGSGEEE